MQGWDDDLRQQRGVHRRRPLHSRLAGTGARHVVGVRVLRRRRANRAAAERWARAECGRARRTVFLAGMS